MALLRPLLDARMSLYQRWTHRHYVHRGWWLHRYYLYKQRFFYGYYLGSYWKINNRIIKRFGAFVVLATVSEGLRRMCAVKEGLIGILLKPWSGWLNALAEYYKIVVNTLAEYHTRALKEIDDWCVATFGKRFISDKRARLRLGLEEKTPEEQTPEEETPEEQTTEEQTTEEQTTEEQIDDDASPRWTPQQRRETNPWFQPSLQTEGLFFCPDLTKRDESMILPFLFIGSFAASILFAPRADTAVPSEGDTPASTLPSLNDPPEKTATKNELFPGLKKNDTPASTPPASKDLPKKSDTKNELFSGLNNMQRLFLTATIFIFPSALQMPSALLLYFISNIGIGALQTRMLARQIPVRAAPRTCRRPVRMNSFKERD